MGVTETSPSGLIVPAGAGARSTVQGYDPRLHDPFFDQMSDQLADKGFVTAALDDVITQVEPTKPSSSCSILNTRSVARSPIEVHMVSNIRIPSRLYSTFGSIWA